MKFKGIILFTLVLFLAFTLTANMGVASAVNQSATVNNTSTSTQYTNSSSTSNVGYGEGTATNKTIKVLIYNGEYSIASCVNGIKTGLNSANANGLVPGYYFSYATSTVINSATLSGYDLVALPGGTGGSYYINSGSISATALKNFVASGKGYLGICAGAYSGAAYTRDWYYGWGLAPHINCEHPWVEGDVPIKIEAAGQELWGYGGTIIMAHYNGPAFYYSGDVVVFATYADNSIGVKGLGAIVGDYYGLGRSVLCGPHPELDPMFPDILANIVVWAANVSSTPTSGTTVTMDQLGTAANSVKSYYETNKKLPNNITINDQQVSMSSFLYLLTTGTLLANGSNAALTLKSVDAATSPSGSIKSGSILKSEYLSIAQNILSYISANGKAPNSVTTSLGDMSFDNSVYMYSKVVNYYKTNGRLPNYVSMAASSTTPTLTTVTMSQVGSAAATVKSYYESNKVLPSSFNIASQTFSMPSFLNLLTTATIQANSGSTADITLKTVDAPTSPSGTITSGNIFKSEFLSIAQTIKTYITSNSKAPNYISTSLGNLSFEKTVYMFSKIMNFYKTNNRLPNYVGMS